MAWIGLSTLRSQKLAAGKLSVIKNLLNENHTIENWSLYLFDHKYATNENNDTFQEAEQGKNNTNA